MEAKKKLKLLVLWLGILCILAGAIIYDATRPEPEPELINNVEIIRDSSDRITVYPAPANTQLTNLTFLPVRVGEATYFIFGTPQLSALITNKTTNGN